MWSFLTVTGLSSWNRTCPSASQLQRSSIAGTNLAIEVVVHQGIHATDRSLIRQSVLHWRRAELMGVCLQLWL